MRLPRIKIHKIVHLIRHARQETISRFILPGVPRITDGFVFAIESVVVRRSFQMTYQNVQKFMRICLPQETLKKINLIDKKNSLIL